MDWTQHADPGIKYFSGSATYEKHFTLTQNDMPGDTPLILDLGTVGEVAVVRVNGREAGVLWKEPYRVDIADWVRPGTNQLEVEVTNVWNNRLVGDQSLPAAKQITQTNLSGKFASDPPLIPSGLIGPVQLRTPVQVEAVWE